MACTHLKQLFQLCQEHDLQFSSSDLVRIVCRECGSVEVCPSSLVSDGGDGSTDAAASRAPRESGPEPRG